MSTLALSNRRRFPSVEIDVSLAYEFLMTLCTISFPQDPQDPQDLEASEETGGWYEATRAKASPDLVEAIEQFSSRYEKIWTHLLGLAYDCPPPRDVAAFIAHLKAIEASELLLHLVGYYLRPFRRATHPSAGRASQDSETTKNYLLDILQLWYEEIFHEEEAQLMPILVRDAKAKRMLKQMVSPKQLIEMATNGFDYVPEPYIREVILIPSFILRPWVITYEHHDVKIFCYPVADESLMEDDEAPPVRLVRLCKAFADERRLRILKKLTMGDYSLQEVADDFGVVKSTMNHHFMILRTAALVRLRTSDNQYSLRHEAIAEMCELLDAYLAKK